MPRECLYFTAPRSVSIQHESLPSPKPDQVLVQTQLSAISPGTETLIYRGELPAELPLDESIPSLQGSFSYPFQYGYAAVGRVIEAGSQVDGHWLDKAVFAFQPHASHFAASPHELQQLPEDLSLEDAVFLPNMETAVNLVMDGAPLLGEKIVVFGQGVVGLLVTALLARFPLASLVTLDRFPLRRQASLASGAHASLDPFQSQALKSDLAAAQAADSSVGADLVYELSGSPQALDQAIGTAGYHGRIVIGSWYGDKTAALQLGGRFHRDRLRLISSQVSTLAPELSGRWTKARRFQVAWEMLAEIKPSRFITHRFPLRRASEAYHLLDQTPEESIQVIFTY